MLWAFAFVQPLLDLLGRNAEFFVARGNGRGDILAFTLALSLLPPLLMLGIEGLAYRFSRRVAALAHLAFVGILAAAIVLGLVNESETIPSGLQVALAVGAGAGAALAYRTAGAVRSLLSFLIPAPALFVALFLLTTEVSELVGPEPAVEPLAVSGARDAPVLVILFDELPVATLMTPGGQLDSRRFPSFARLAGSSTWYRQATTVADRTERAVPAILTGLEPDPGLEPSAETYPRNLFSTFAGSYQLNAYESATRLCPSSLCEDPIREPFASRMRSLVGDLRLVSEHLLLPPAVTAGLPPIDQGFLGFDGAVDDRQDQSPDEQRLASLLEGFERNGSEPSLNFIHFDTPHIPWLRLPDGSRCQAETFNEVRWTDSASVWIDDKFSAQQGLAAHLLQVGYADRLLGALIDRLEAQGVWDDAAVVVVSDHGASFEAGEARRTLTEGNAGAVMRVPMFVKAPGQERGSVSDRPVRTIDVLPTVADLVGAELPFDVDGVPVGRPREATNPAAYGGFDSNVQSFDQEYLERQRAELSRRKVEVLGRGGGLADAFELGPRPDLLGEPTEALTSLPNEGEGYELVAPELYDDVEKADDPPCQILASLEDVEPGTELAVTVNGEVAATTYTYDATSDEAQAFAIVDPSRFVEGSNEVELWRIEGDGPDTGLAPVE